MSKEGKIYLILAAIAFLALNIGLFIFSYQHAIKNFGPDKGSLDPIHFTGMACTHALFNRSHHIRGISNEG